MVKLYTGKLRRVHVLLPKTIETGPRSFPTLSLYFHDGQMSL